MLYTENVRNQQKLVVLVTVASKSVFLPSSTTIVVWSAAIAHRRPLCPPEEDTNVLGPSLPTLERGISRQVVQKKSSQTGAWNYLRIWHGTSSWHLKHFFATHDYNTCYYVYINDTWQNHAKFFSHVLFDKIIFHDCKWHRTSNILDETLNYV